MRENISLIKILKNCPNDEVFYSPAFGNVHISVDLNNIILYSTTNVFLIRLNYNGCINNEGECMVFPSKDQRDWSKFTAPWYKKDRFDPKTLKPFDKVLVKQCDIWYPDFYSCYIEDDDSHVCSGLKDYYFCIPYNDDTKHLAGTKDEAPEYYRYWED